MRKRIIVIVAVFVVAAVALTATVIAVRENTKDQRPVKTGERSGSFEIIENVENNVSVEPFQRADAERERDLTFMGETIRLSYVESQNRGPGFISDVYSDGDGGKLTLNEDGMLLGFGADVSTLDDSVLGDGDITGDEAVGIARATASEAFGSETGELDLISVRDDGEWYTVTLGEKLGPDGEIEGTNFVAMVLRSGQVFNASCSNRDMLDGFDRSRLDGLDRDDLSGLLDKYLSDGLGDQYRGMRISKVRVEPLDGNFALRVTVYPIMAIDENTEGETFGTSVYVSIP